MGLALEPDQLHKGLFYRYRDQQWLPADWWLLRLGVDHSWQILRVENLLSDFLDVLARFEPVGEEAVASIRQAPSLNCNIYNKDWRAWFGKDDLDSIYEANPVWRTLERHVYGNLVMEL